MDLFFKQRLTICNNFCHKSSKSYYTNVFFLNPMKIIYSPFFTTHQFVAMPDGQVMMDCSIVDTEGLLSLL